MYVAYVDESGNGGPVFAVGGLLAKPDQWRRFSDQWQSVLDARPSIPHFKFSNRQALSIQEHRAKIDALIEVINGGLVERGDLILVHVAQYKAFFGEKMGATYDNPFYQGYVHVMQQSALHLPDPEGKIDFVFDMIDDTQYLELLKAHRRFKEICPNQDVKRRFGREPVRGDDEEVLPLQAADLWVGLMRRSYEGDNNSADLLNEITITNRCFVWDEPHLQQLLVNLQTDIPLIESGIFYESPKRRSSRLAPARNLLRRKPRAT
jgi:hypothetical protein